MIADNLDDIRKGLPDGVSLVAVSKFHPVGEIAQAYAAGQRLFGENRPQELASKVGQLPGDISWHFIGHLQTNKLKLVLPYASLVQSIDSLKLLEAVDKWGKANGKVVDILLEMHIASEETKQGFDEAEILSVLERAGDFPGVRFRGLMGMATNTPDTEVVEAEFARIGAFKAEIGRRFPELGCFDQLSIGMSGDWRLAIKHGATIVRIGTAIFGPRHF